MNNSDILSPPSIVPSYRISKLGNFVSKCRGQSNDQLFGKDSTFDFVACSEFISEHLTDVQ